MKIAVPIENDVLCQHFGRCQEFAIVETDEKTRTVINQQKQTSPPHQPYLLPRWLHDAGAEMIIANGMGCKALQQFSNNGIKVFVGAPIKPVQELIQSYFDGHLVNAENACDH